MTRMIKYTPGYQKIAAQSAPEELQKKKKKDQQDKVTGGTDKYAKKTSRNQFLQETAQLLRNAILSKGLSFVW